MAILDFTAVRKKRTLRLHNEGEALSDAGEKDAAIEKYLAALQLDPDRPQSLYNIGLIHKYRGAWEASFDFSQRAHTLAPDDQATRWNLGIAATALRRWEVARQMWQDEGLELEPASGPIEMNFGMTPVRLNPDGDGEVVWARRIDPVRARIGGVPFPESGFRHGDVVLHDGAPVGERRWGKLDYPVFNVLMLFERSDESTFVALVVAPDKGEIERLETLAVAAGIEVEDWTGNVRIICRQCSEGLPHEEHDEELAEAAWQPRRNIGISAMTRDAVDALVQDWLADGPVTLVEPVSGIADRPSEG